MRNKQTEFINVYTHNTQIYYVTDASHRIYEYVYITYYNDDAPIYYYYNDYFIYWC